MTILVEYMILYGADNRPSMLDKDLYDSWKSRMKLYMHNIKHRRMILESVEHGPLIWPTIEENRVTRTKKYAELFATEKFQADCDIKAITIILQGLPAEIYSLVNQHRVSKDPWEKFNFLCKYYLRFTHQINDMNIYNMKLEQFQVNTKFLNRLPPEWSKFVTDVKLVKDLHTTNFDQLYAYLEQHELHANEFHLMRERNQDPLALVANHQMTPSHFDNYQSLYTNPMFQQQFSPSQSHQYSTHPTQHYSTTYSSTPHAITYPSAPYPHVYSLTVHQEACPQPQSGRKNSNAVGTSGTKANTSGTRENYSDHGIAEGLVTQSVITHNAAYQADNLDAYDFDYDEISIAKAVLMAKLSSYGSDVLSEDKNSSAQQDALILSVFEQLSNQVTNCNKVNNDNMIANETLFAKLERYKERVKLLEERQDVDLALGFQNPFYLKKAQQIRPMLYVGNVIAKETNVISIADSEETLKIEEESRSKIVKPSTSASGSKPSGNPKNDRSSRTPTSNGKNKVEVQSRKVKSKLNKQNSDSKNVCNEHFKHHVKGAHALCYVCNECLFDANHAMCLINHVNSINVRDKSASKKNKKRKEWKPTGKVFNSVRYKWKPTERAFTLVGNACLLTRITATNKVPHRVPIPLEVVSPEHVVTRVYTRRPKVPKSVLNSKTKVAISMIANIMESDTSWGSDTLVSLSSYSFINCRPLFSSTRVKPSTSASGSKPSGNPKNDRSSRTPTSNGKNKVEVQSRKVKSKLNKQNSDSKNVCNEHFKHHVKGAHALCYVCNECLFDANHAMCLINHVNSINVRDKSASKKNKKRKEWKPTGKVFNSVRYKWKPTERAFTLVGNACLLTRITATNKVPHRVPIPLEVVSPEHVVTRVYTRRPKVPKSVLNSKTKVVQIVLWYLDSGCSKHMIGDHSQLTNFVHKFLGTVKLDNGNEFVNQTLQDYYEQFDISYKTTVARTPQQNGNVERRNRTLVEAAQTMLIYVKAPIFLWVEVPVFDEFYYPLASFATLVPVEEASAPVESTDSPSSTTFECTLTKLYARGMIYFSSFFCYLKDSPKARLISHIHRKGKYILLTSDVSRVLYPGSAYIKPTRVVPPIEAAL
nr:integrase, catalytic region, zinc finger, CCHC-type, peptidase aspartic, catalytic [Tanacetum cinerariifolium]